MRGGQCCFSRSQSTNVIRILRNLDGHLDDFLEGIDETRIAELEGNKLVLYVGYSHPVKMEPPAGIKFEVDTRTRQIKVLGFDKELVGQMAANIREVRPPEAYKGKGIKYLDETIRRKAGKAGKV